jgi:uncharacterized protein with beta-barrel porin domain
MCNECSLVAANFSRVAVVASWERGTTVSPYIFGIRGIRTASAFRAAGAAIAGFASAVCLVAIPWDARGETFNQASSAAFVNICQTGTGTGNLAAVCRQAVPGPGSATGFGAISAPTAAAFIEERRRIGSGDENAPTVGASSDSASYDLGAGWSGFVSAGGESLNHHNNKFEDGYSSAIPKITVGADYRITDWVTAGLAMNYFYQDGTYDDGGDFHTNSFGPIVYVSFTPLPNVFTDVALGYNHQDNNRNRKATATASDGTVIDTGHISGSFNGDQYSAGFLSGYDHQFEGFTIGPRGGLNYVYTNVENYSEANGNALALRYSGMNQSSLQTTLGAVATRPISTSLGVVQPQIGVSWVHEFLNDARNIQAKYLNVVDPSATQFTFQREHPARDWAVIDVAVSMVLPNQLQPFISFTTIQGNENLVSYGGQVGLRMGF